MLVGNPLAAQAPSKPLEEGLHLVVLVLFPANRHVQGAAGRATGKTTRRMHALVREMAHHSAAMDLLNEAISAIQRQGARDLPEFAHFTARSALCCMTPCSPGR